MSVRLYWSVTEETELATALQGSTARALLGESEVIGLLYSADACRFGRHVPPGVLVGPDGLPLRLEVVFEARIFGPTTELRWLHGAGGKGRAVLLSETCPPAGLESSFTSEEFLGTLEQTYLVWGDETRQPIAEGWSRLATSRIGLLDVPAPPAGHHSRRCFRTREYLQKAAHGNVIVAEERLIGLEVTRG